MEIFKSRFKQFFCAFCRSERSIKYQKHIGLFEFSMSLGASLILMILFWQKFDFKFFIFFAVILSFMEFLIQVKGRLLLVCPHCGFDPVLYKKNPEKCAVKVKEFLESRKKNPVTMLYKKPILNLPKIKKNEGQKRDSRAIESLKNNKNNLDLRL